MAPPQTSTAQVMDNTPQKRAHAITNKGLAPEIADLARELEEDPLTPEEIEALPPVQRVVHERAANGNSALYSANGNRRQIASLSPRHRAIMRAVLKGLNNVEIAELSGLSQKAVSVVINSDLFQAGLAEMEAKADNKCIDTVADVRAKIKEMSGHSIVELDKMLKERRLNPRLKADICFDILDRAGYKPVEKRVDFNIAVNLSKATIDAYKRRKLERSNMHVVESKIVPPGTSSAPDSAERPAGSAAVPSCNEDPNSQQSDDESTSA